MVPIDLPEQEIKEKMVKDLPFLEYEDEEEEEETEKPVQEPKETKKVEEEPIPLRPCDKKVDLYVLQQEPNHESHATSSESGYEH